jgi:hypothetical protein
MLSSRRRRIGIAAVLATIGIVGVAFAAGRAAILLTHRHVVIEAFNVDSVEQVSVNCEQAMRVGKQQSRAAVDLGWLTPDERVFLSATSRDRNPAWGFHGSSNGTTFFKGKRGDAEVPGYTTEEDAVVFARAYSAGGHYLGHIGCQPPVLVAVQGYVRSNDDADVPRANGPGPPYQPQHADYDRIDAIGSWSLIPLAAIGIAAALGIGPIRRLGWAHRKAAVSALGLLAALTGLFFGVLHLTALLTIFTIGGTALLFLVAVLLILPGCWRHLEHAAATDGAAG